jgi:hypothetical protein
MERMDKNEYREKWERREAGLHSICIFLDTEKDKAQKEEVFEADYRGYISRLEKREMPYGT